MTPKEALAGSSALRDDKLDFIDSLRGLAALGIVLYHAKQIPQPKLGLPSWLEPYVDLLASAVPLFFAISAFTLVLSHYRKMDEPLHVQRFLLRRLFRIYPLYYVMLAVYTARGLLGHGGVPGLAEWIAYLTLSFNVWPAHHEGMVWASWSLSVENIFYLLLPLLLAWMGTLGRAAGFLLLSLAGVQMLGPALLAAMPGPAGEHFLHFFFLNQIPFFGAGLLAFFLSVEAHRRWADRPARLESLAQILAAAALLILVCTVHGRLDQPLGILHWRGVGFGLLLLSVSLWPQRLLVNRVTRYYGKISYSLYLLHPLVIVDIMMKPYRRIYLSLPSHPVLAYLICIALTLAVLTPLAALSYAFIEKPGIQLGHRVMSAMLRRHRAAPTAATPQALGLAADGSSRGPRSSAPLEPT